MTQIPKSHFGNRRDNLFASILFADKINADNQFYYHLSNLSDAAGGGELPVVTPLSFNCLTLSELYADGSEVSLPLQDLDGKIHIELHPDAVYLNSCPRFVCDDDRGPVVATTLSGCFDEQYVHILMHGERPAVCVKIERSFELTLPFPAFGAYTSILCRDINGISYPVGTFGIVRG